MHMTGGGWTAVSGRRATMALAGLAPLWLMGQPGECESDSPAPDRRAAQAEVQWAEGWPRAVVDEPIHDFGTFWAYAGSYVEHTFILRNDGTDPFTILRVVHVCACIGYDTHADEEVPPGESVELPLKLKADTLAGAKDGKFHKTILVRTNDPVQPEIRLELVGVARRLIDAPSLISFGTLAANAVAERVVTLTNNIDTPIDLTLPRTEPSPESPFAYDLYELQRGFVYELRVRTVPPLPEGRINATLMLKTTTEAQPEVEIRVVVNVPRRLLVRPSMVVYDPKRPTRPVTFANNGPTSVKVTGATTDDPALAVEVEEWDSGKNYTIKVTFPQNYDSPARERTLVIKTNDPEQPEIEVPIRTHANYRRRRPAKELELKRVPAFSMTTVAGEVLESAMLASHDAVVLAFWAAECPYSKKALPRLDGVREEFSGYDVRFINIAETMRRRFTEEGVQQVVADLRLGGELVFDPENRLGPTFKVASYPTMFIVGGTGRVERVIIGNTNRLEVEVGEALTRLTGG